MGWGFGTLYTVIVEGMCDCGGLVHCDSGGYV